MWDCMNVIHFPPFEQDLERLAVQLRTASQHSEVKIFIRLKYENKIMFHYYKHIKLIKIVLKQHRKPINEKCPSYIPLIIYI